MLRLALEINQAILYIGSDPGREIERERLTDDYANSGFGIISMPNMEMIAPGIERRSGCFSRCSSGVDLKG